MTAGTIVITVKFFPTFLQMLIEHDLVQTRDVRLSGSAFHHQFLIRATAMMVSSRHHPLPGRLIFES